MTIVYVDRSCADSIWSVLTPISVKLIESGHDVVWVKMSSVESADRVAAPQGVKTYIINVPPDNYPCAWLWQMRYFVPRFREVLKSLRPDIVHTNFIVPGVAARYLGARYAKRVISTQHEIYQSMNRLLRWASRWSDQYVDDQVYVSKTVAQSYGRNQVDVLKVDGDLETNEVVIYNGIDFSRIENAREKVSHRSPMKLLCVGRMMQEKGQAFLIKMLPDILRKFPQVQLHFCGSGPEEVRLKSLAESQLVNESVHFHGWLDYDAVYEMMCNSSIILQPSDGSQEGFGLSLVEAVASDSCVVVSDIPVFREVLNHIESTRVTFALPKVQDSWVDAICNYLEQVPSNPNNAQEKLKRAYSPEVNALLYKKVYGI